MAKTIMVQGTMSNAGKSLVVAGLCRVFTRKGYRVSPFKSQNMALNSFATPDDLEIGRAQAMQAEACGVEPEVIMNPVLLKPTGDSVSQVIVKGKPIGNMTAREYFKFKTSLIPDINKAFSELASKNDIIVIEGAGSPAEINLREKDIVNMGLADMVDAPVILVGDIDRGGVFAQLYGTYMLLSEREKELLKGVVINKFRGDKSLLDPGIEMMKEKMDVPFVGVLPYINLNIDDEDSLTDRFKKQKPGLIDIVAVRLPRISNYTDLDVFTQYQGVTVRYTEDPDDILVGDMVVLPGTKNTLADLKWLKEKNLDEAVIEARNSGIPIVGICGGFQMLGNMVKDPLGIEEGGEAEGLGLLPLVTTMEEKKITKQRDGHFPIMEGFFSCLSGCSYSGYEIHTGDTEGYLEYFDHNVLGTYVHGIFDEEGIASRILEKLAREKGVSLNLEPALGRRKYKEKEYDRLADMIEENMNMEAIYGMLKEANLFWEN